MNTVITNEGWHWIIEYNVPVLGCVHSLFRSHLSLDHFERHFSDFLLQNCCCSLLVPIWSLPKTQSYTQLIPWSSHKQVWLIVILCCVSDKLYTYTASNLLSLIFALKIWDKFAQYILLHKIYIYLQSFGFLSMDQRAKIERVRIFPVYSISVQSQNIICPLSNNFDLGHLNCITSTRFARLTNSPITCEWLHYYPNSLTNSPSYMWMAALLSPIIQGVNIPVQSWWLWQDPM